MSLSSSDAEENDLHYAAVICVLAWTGLFTNGLSLWTIFRTRHLWNAFGYSCASHAAGACGVLLVFVLYVTPMSFLHINSVPRILANPRVSYTVGQISIIFYYAAIYAHILIAINRFVVICKPLSYTRYFSKEMTIRWIAVVWIVAFLQSCMYQIDGCHYFYEKSVHTFTYSNTRCGLFISMYLEFGINLAFVFFVVIADTLTVIKLKVSSNDIKSFSCISMLAQRKRRKQEIRFFVQSVCSELALISCFACFWGFVHLVESPWHRFLLNTGAWLLLHALDGIILVAFNRSIHWICCPKKNKYSAQKLITDAETPDDNRVARSTTHDARSFSLSRNVSYV